MYVFGDLLRQFRVRAGLTQQQLADKLGVSRNALNAWETLKARPRLSRELIIRLGKDLVLEWDDLNQLLLALGYTLEPVEYSTQAQVVRHKAIETQYLKVTQQLELAPGVLWPQSGGRADCYQHVSLPVNYIERADILASVRTQVLATAAPVVITSAVKEKPAALHGMGGIGKTVVARALCDDSAIREAFPDGILWATLGQTPNLLDQLRLWIEALGGRIGENAPTVESLKRTLATLLKERTCLLILDDVWQHTHANAFRVDAPRCRLLLTGRDAEVARELGAQVQHIPLMTPADAIALLEEWADGYLAETDPALKEKIVKRLGYLPLAVKLAGAQLQRKDPEEWLRAFDVRKLKSKRPEDLHDSLEQTLLLSLDALDVLPRHLYLTLAIFKEDEAAPQTAIEQLWQGLAGLDASASSDPLDDLAARALLDLALQGASHAARLHDLMREFIGTALGEDGQLAAHRALLDAYRATCTGDGWHTAPDDGYLYDHLAYHLDALGAWDDLYGLFADQSWMEVRVPQRAYTYDGYLEDLSLAWASATSEARRQVDADQEPLAIRDCLRYLLIAASINSIVENYVPEVVVRAVEVGLWTPSRAFSVAAQMPYVEDYLKVCIALLYTDKLSEEQKREVRYQSLRAIANVAWEETRARVLIALAPQLTEAFAGPALELALALDDEALQEEAIKALRPHLTEELVGHAMETALREARYRALAAVAPLLTEASVERVLKVALSLDDEAKQAAALVALVPRLAAHLAERAVEAARVFSDGLLQVQVLVSLAPRLTMEHRTLLLEQMLDAALALEFDEQRAEIMVVLASQLEGALLERALEAALHLELQWDRAKALVALAPQLSGILAEKALKAASEFVDVELQAQVMMMLQPYLTPQQHSLLLAHMSEIVENLEDDWAKAEFIATIAPQLTGKLAEQAAEFALALEDTEARTRGFMSLPSPVRRAVVEQALDMSLVLQYEESQANLVMALAPVLRGEFVERALNVALALEDGKDQATLVAALAPQLPAGSVAQALNGALRIEDTEDQVKAVAVLVPLLRESQQGEVLAWALNAAQTLKFEEARAEALVALAPSLTGELRERALDVSAGLEDERYRARVIAVLAHSLQDERRWAIGEQLFDMALTPNFEGIQAQLLKALAPLLRGRRVEQALESALDMQFEGACAQILVALAPRLTEELVERALSVSFSREREEMWAQVLASLAPRLNGERQFETVKKILEEAVALKDEKCRAQVLIALTPQLKGEQRWEAVEQALTAALALKDTTHKIQLLIKILPYLSGERLTGVFARLQGEALELGDKWARARSLTECLPFEGDSLPLLRFIRVEMLEALESVKYSSRQQVFRRLILSHKVFASPIVSPETLNAIILCLIEICEQWQWL